MLQTLILGNRHDIEEMSGGAATVLTAVLKLIDRYDLYGCVAYPKHHKQTDVPHIYRLAAKTKVRRPFILFFLKRAFYGSAFKKAINSSQTATLLLGHQLTVREHNSIPPY